MSTILPTTPSFDGHFVSLSGGRLVRMDSSGQQHTHLLAADTRVTCDGRVCRPNELEAGQRIRITNDSRDPKIVARVEVLNTHDRFAG
jgi:hypothetical protein